MIKKITIILQLLIFSTLSLIVITGAKPVFAAPCTGGSFLGLPAWYSHLECVETTDIDTITGDSVTRQTPQISGLNDTWKIVASVLEILLRLASLIAIGFVVYGGILYIASQGSPDKTKQALNTVISAVVGLVITITAAAIVSFVAARFTSAPNSTPVTNDRSGPR